MKAISVGPMRRVTSSLERDRLWGGSAGEVLERGEVGTGVLQDGDFCHVLFCSLFAYAGLLSVSGAC